MPTVQIKMVSSLLGACVFASAMAAFAEDAAKPSSKAAGKGVTTQTAKSASAKGGAAKTASAKSPGSGRMQVEVPKASAPPSDARASKAWQKSHAKGLTEEQKNAFRDRKEGMANLITVIKAKRKALHEAKPEHRAALARELHSLILEKDGNAAVTAAARVEASAAKETKAAPQADAAAAKAEERAQRHEEYRKQQLDKMKEWKAKAKEED